MTPPMLIAAIPVEAVIAMISEDSLFSLIISRSNSDFPVPINFMIGNGLRVDTLTGRTSEKYVFLCLNSGKYILLLFRENYLLLLRGWIGIRSIGRVGQIRSFASMVII